MLQIGPMGKISGLRFSSPGFSSQEKQSGTSQNLSVYDYVQKANLFVKQNNWAAATEQLREALSVGVKALGPHHKGIGSIHSFLGQSYLKNGQIDLADHHFIEGLRILKPLTGEAIEYAKTLLHYSQLWIQTGKFDLADRLIRWVECMVKIKKIKDEALNKLLTNKQATMLQTRLDSQPGGRQERDFID